MKQVYLSLLLAGLTAAPALGQKTTVNAFPKPLAPVANAGMKAPQFHLPSAIDDKKKGITMYAGQRLDQSKHRSWVSRSPPTISRLAFTSCAPPTATTVSSRRWWSAKYFLVLAPSWRGGRRKFPIEAGWKAVVLSSCLCLYLCLLRLPIYSPIKRQHE